VIKKLLIKNFKSVKEVTIELNHKINIFVGENDSGKSTILEALSIITTGRLHFYPFERQIKANLFNVDIRREYIKAIAEGKNPEPPKIIIEAYLDDNIDPKISGKNNEQRENVPGIRMIVEMDREYSEVYKQMLSSNSVYDIPVELYKVSYNYFSGSEKVIFRFSPLKSVFIDAAHKDYSYMVDKFINTSINDILDQQDKIELSREYRNARYIFKEAEQVKKLNKEVAEKNKFDDRKVSIDLNETRVDSWIEQMTVVVEDTPFEYVGFGTQNTIKSELALENSADKINIIIMEEPENNLSYTNMAKLIERVEATAGKQIFIATHSSYVANKLDLKNLFLVNEGSAKAFSKLDKDTVNYFKKLPGYNTLRVVLAEKVILVEGPTDELILQRAYMDMKGHLPIKDGIDIIVVDSLAFKKYCAIAVMIGKQISIVTDNDGNIKGLKERYSDYIDNPLTRFFYEKNETFNTLEPSVLNANCEDDGIPTEKFKNVVYKKSKNKKLSFEEMSSFMQKNKTEWAMRVFDSEEKIEYPEYITDVINQFN
jgi:hypothetical protein